MTHQISEADTRSILRKGEHDANTNENGIDSHASFYRHTG